MSYYDRKATAGKDLADLCFKICSGDKETENSKKEEAKQIFESLIYSNRAIHEYDRKYALNKIVDCYIKSQDDLLKLVENEKVHQDCNIYISKQLLQIYAQEKNEKLIENFAQNEKVYWTSRKYAELLLGTISKEDKQSINHIVPVNFRRPIFLADDNYNVTQLNVNNSIINNVDMENHQSIVNEDNTIIENFSSSASMQQSDCENEEKELKWKKPKWKKQKMLRKKQKWQKRKLKK